MRFATLLTFCDALWNMPTTQHMPSLLPAWQFQIRCELENGHAKREYVGRLRVDALNDFVGQILGITFSCFVIVTLSWKQRD